MVYLIGKQKCRLFLIEEHAAKRLAWCLVYRHWSTKEWGIVV